MLTKLKNLFFVINSFCLTKVFDTSTTHNTETPEKVKSSLTTKINNLLSSLSRSKKSQKKDDTQDIMHMRRNSTLNDVKVNVHFHGGSISSFQEVRVIYS